MDAVAANREFYDGLWPEAQLIEAQRFNTWPLVESLLTSDQARLEVAPGLHPHLPIAGTRFVDISHAALGVLRRAGAAVSLGSITELPFPAASFDLVAAFDIVEHVDDDNQGLAELARVTRPGGHILLSLPLHPSMWTAFDDYVGHRHRYRPEDLARLLAAHGLEVERSAVFGLQPRSRLAAEISVWFLTRHRRRAMWWYNRALPWILHFQKELRLQSGMVPTDDVDEILLVCRRAVTRNAAQ